MQWIVGPVVATNTYGLLTEEFQMVSTAYIRHHICRNKWLAVVALQA